MDVASGGAPAGAQETAPRSPASRFQPYRMAEIELTQPLPSFEHDPTHPRLWLLARLNTEPIGTVRLDVPPSGLDRAVLATAVWTEVQDAAAARFRAAGLSAPLSLPLDGLRLDPAHSPFLRGRAAVLAEAPLVSVVIATRNRPDRLAECLSDIALLEYPNVEVVVVDNAPSSPSTSARAVTAQAPVPVRCVLEPRPGLSWARNRGISVARGDIIAFLDDDEVPDRYWACEVVRGFTRDPGVGCVTGLILPAHLDTASQERFEAFGGHSKGHAFEPLLFSPGGPQHPLYPRPPFGAGGNMAFRREVLDRIGGFDPALGAGTPARGCEDTLAFTLTLLSGYSIAYEPSAFVRHDHYGEVTDFERQLQGYSTGLSAYYAALLRARPGLLPSLLRLLPRGARDLYGRDSLLTTTAPGNHGSSTLRHLVGFLSGPLAYARSRRRQGQVDARLSALSSGEAS